jgi:hypothetical protein
LSRVDQAAVLAFRYTEAEGYSLYVGYNMDANTVLIACVRPKNWVIPENIHTSPMEETGNYKLLITKIYTAILIY